MFLWFNTFMVIYGYTEIWVNAYIDTYIYMNIWIEEYMNIFYMGMKIFG